jgi:hypothetical protein
MKKKKKINSMTKEEIEEAIDRASMQMGGTDAEYIRQLIRRYEQLTGEKW